MAGTGRALSPAEQEAAWRRFVERARREPELPFDEHWREFTRAYGARRREDGPAPVWWPGPEHLRKSNLARWADELGFDGFAALHAWSTRERAAFWASAIRSLGIVFRREPDAILDLSDGVEAAHWLVGARLDCVDSCFRAPGDRPAIVSGAEGRDAVVATTYDELERTVRRFAGGLRQHGFRPGDGVALYMPMTAECVVAYLGVLRAGCRAITVADSFPAPELARRLRLGRAAGIVTADRFRRGGRTIEPWRVVREAEAPRAVVVPSPGPTRRPGDLAWEELLGDDGFAGSGAEAEAVTTVLFSSGTTGDPKAIPWTQTTPIKCAMDGKFHQDIRPGDVVAWPTNIGWMMGPWLIFATLINGGTIALFEGAPTGSEFVRFVERAGVTVLGVVPSLVRAWRAAGVRGDDWRRVRVFSSTGEPSSVEDYLWLMSRTGYRAPVIEYCGGTEIGGGYVTGTVLQPASPATFSAPALGLDLVLRDERGGFVAREGTGEVFLVPPSIGLSQRLLNRDHHEVYHAGCPVGPRGEILRRHGDQLELLPGGSYRAQGRADDTMNLGGIKVGSLEIERVLSGHPEVVECAAVGVAPPGGGPERLVVFAVLAGSAEPARLRSELGRRLAAELNPLFRVDELVAVDRLPRTASNKLMRRQLRDDHAGRGR